MHINALDLLSIAPGAADTRDSASDALVESTSGRTAVDERTAYEAPSQFEEAFRTLRSNLLLRAADDVRAILVASALPGEGKTTVAANLACSLTALQKRVLLIDADLRRPSVHRLFRTPNTHGLVDVLRGTHAAERTWHQTKAGPVVLPSGTPPADPQALFESGEFDALLSLAREEFDFIIVDSAPLLAVADTTLITPKVDGVVVVMKYAAVTESEAALAYERLRNAGGNILGGILSQVTSTTDAFYAYDRSYLEKP